MKKILPLIIISLIFGCSSQKETELLSKLSKSLNSETKQKFQTIEVFNKHDSKIEPLLQPMFGDELEDDFDSTQYGVFAQEQYIKPLEFTISKCGERTLISMINNSNKDHGTEGTRTSYLKSILANQTSEIAEKLNVE
jgi:replicative superfamily II helicase